MHPSMDYSQIDYNPRSAVEIATSDRSHEIDHAPRNDTGERAGSLPNPRSAIREIYPSVTVTLIIWSP
jgi:hypothetical protein